MAHNRKIAVIGLGYVGLPVAVAFARSGAPVIDADINATRVAELTSGHVRTREVDEADLRQTTLTYTSAASALKAADFHIVTVPTPTDAVIFAVAHADYVAQSSPLVMRLLNGVQGIVVDVQARLDRACKPDGVDLCRL